MLPSPSLPRLLQLGGFIFKYHAAMVVYGARRINGAAGGAAGGSGGLEGGASGSGLSFIDSTASPAEISQQLTPGSSGKGPFDLTRYAGFCRKMRVGGRVVGWCSVRWVGEVGRGYPVFFLCLKLIRNTAGLLQRCILVCGYTPHATA